MIAVTFALPSESGGFRKLARVRGDRVAVLHTGVGKDKLNASLEPFLRSHSFDLLIASGFAGGMEHSLGIGDLVFGENFSDPLLLAHAQELLVARVGKLLTVDKIIESAEERARVAAETQALAVDMETAFIAKICAERQLPMLALRAISDTAAAPFPVPPAVLFDLARQRTNFFGLARHLARHPRAIVRLNRFAGQIREARSSLTNALGVLVRELGRK